jgi:hypothetical protein
MKNPKKNININYYKSLNKSISNLNKNLDFMLKMCKVCYQFITTKVSRL